MRPGPKKEAKPAPVPVSGTVKAAAPTDCVDTGCSPISQPSTEVAATTVDSSSTIDVSATMTNSASYKLSLTLMSTTAATETTPYASSGTLASSQANTSSGVVSSTAVPTESASSSAITSTSSSSSSGSSSGISHHTEVIILASIFSVLGAICLGTVAFFLFRRCKGRRNSFRSSRHGGVTPIDDSEIDSWRLPRPPAMAEAGALPAGISESKPNSSHAPQHSSNSIVYTHSPGWNEGFAVTPLEIPSYTARAPNARTGLTDQSRPGDDPFVGTAPQRQPSRLQKQRVSSHSQHGRSRSQGGKTKSRASSISASIQERPPTWFDGEDMVVQKALEELTHGNAYQQQNGFSGSVPPTPTRHSRGRGSRGVADYDEKDDRWNGLSPRPASRGRDITNPYYKKDEES